MRRKYPKETDERMERLLDQVMSEHPEGILEEDLAAEIAARMTEADEAAIVCILVAEQAHLPPSLRDPRVQKVFEGWREKAPELWEKLQRAQRRQAQSN
jgi:hypothetical protein